MGLSIVLWIDTSHVLLITVFIHVLTKALVGMCDNNYVNLKLNAYSVALLRLKNTRSTRNEFKTSFLRLLLELYSMPMFLIVSDAILGVDVHMASVDLL